jgi:23S rRNA pseudouridine2604 synthase
MARPTLKLSKTVARTAAPDPQAPRSTRAQRAQPRQSAPARQGSGRAPAPSGEPVREPVRAPVRAPAEAPRADPAPRTPERRPLTAPEIVRSETAEDPRLSKRMGELGLCSRREADEWIEKGWVKVDGKVVDTLGVRVRRRRASRSIRRRRRSRANW